MKNILKIFKSDISKLHKNVIALIVIMGLCIVPCLYAWFNIAANFDPYKNTNHLKVAVVNQDKGYNSDIMNLEINFGKDVIYYLSENPKLNWVLTDIKSATKDIKDDKYYAMIVIPENFSKDIMSVFTDKIKKPEIIYYVNEKKNAIAPKITDKGAQGILNYVNQLFSKRIYETMLSTVDNANISEPVKNKLLQRLVANMKNISSMVEKNESQIKNIKTLSQDIEKTVIGSLDLLVKIQKNSEEFINEIKDQEKNIKTSIKAIADNVKGEIKEENQRNLDFIQDEIIPKQRDLENALKDFIEKIKLQRNKLSEIQSKIETIDLLFSDEISNQIQTVLDKMDEIIKRQEDLEKSLDLNDRVIEDIQSILKGNYKNIGLKSIEIRENIDFLNTNDIENLKEEIKKSFKEISSTLDEVLKEQEKIKGKVTKFLNLAENIKNNKNLSTAQKLLKDNPEEIGQYLKAPVKYETKRIYPIANYGSAMAPFYTTLAIWVGAIVMASMMKVKVEKSTLDTLKNPKLHQIYLGRHIIFTVIGLIQSTIIILGDCYYLGIQCESVFKILVVGWISSIVYVNIVYTLTVSFGDVGKAIAVVLMVMQVAGSGGTFPIQVTPKFFQKVYPLLPFVHSMNAMRECIGGFFENSYKLELIKLASFMIPSLILGLLLRKPVIRLNEIFNEKLEDTKIM